MDRQFIYREIAPYKDLAPFIDAYWTVTGANTGYVPDKVLPDACVDIILNTGPGFESEIGATQMDTDQAYLIGTMTRYKEMVRPPGTRLIGVRFKTGGFSCFYDPAILRSTADRTVLFDPSLFPSLRSLAAPSAGRAIPSPTGAIPAAVLNRFFLDRLNPSSRDLLPLLEDIRLQQGRLTVDRLARRHFMTIRRLQRLFDLHLAIGPKEFINFARFQSAVESIRHRAGKTAGKTAGTTAGTTLGKTLLDIACEHGYYDHAHLANAIKKYTGSTPTGL